MSEARKLDEYLDEETGYCERCNKKYDENGPYKLYREYICRDCFENFNDYWENQAEMVEGK